MRKNKFILSTLILSVMIAQTVYASDLDLDAGFVDDRLEVSYEAADGGFGTFVYVFDKKVEAKEEISEEMMRENLIFAGVNNDGKFEVLLDDGAPYGAYTVVLGSQSLPADKAERMVYALRISPEVVQKALEDVFGAKTSAEMAEMLLQHNNIAYISDLTEIESQKDILFELIQEKGMASKPNATVTDLYTLIAMAGDFCNMKTASNSEMETLLEQNNDELMLDEDEIKLIDVLPTEIASLRSKGGKFETVAQIRALVREAVALTALNSATRGEVINVIEKYNDLFEVSYSRTLTGNSLYELEKRLASAVFTDVAGVNGKVNEFIDEIYKEETKTPSGGGGGGGGYVGGAGTTPATPHKLVDDEFLSRPDSAFSDLAGVDWAVEAINELSKREIMKGDGNDLFRPNDNLTREELVKVIVVAFGASIPDDDDSEFSDVLDEWYKPYIASAYNLGIVNGISDDTFGVGELVTRQDAAVMLQRAAAASYIELERKQTLVEFPDFEDVAEYARASVDELARAEIMNGYEDGSFRPFNNITRAEIAKVIYTCINEGVIK